LSHKRWQLVRTPPPAFEIRVGSQIPTGGAGRLASQLLANRGVTGDVEAFLSASPSLAGDPFLLPEMGVAVTRIKWALRQGQPIAIFGDFDADGVTATVLLAEGLAQFGAKVIPYIPHRFDEGYGLNQPALEHLAEQGARLLITVDTGTTAHAEIGWAQSHGLDVVVTDHHTPTSTLPPALANINPRRADSIYPLPPLAGVGVAFKLLQALGMKEDTAATHGLALPAKDLGQGATPSGEGGLDLVALGTVADLMPLLGENRYMVRRGLAALNRGPRLGLRCLMAEAGLDPGQVDSEAISFCLAPRLNAAGRLDHAWHSYSLLTAGSAEDAKRDAATLEAFNQERQRRTEEVCRRAQGMLAAGGVLPPLVMLGDPGFDPGVVGIAASHLADQLYRPVVLFHQGDETCRGSARSVPEFNVVAALGECRPWLLRFGGHPQAAGFTARPDDMPHIQQKLVDLATQQLAGVDLRPRLTIDALVRFTDLTGPFLRFMALLSPFGQGNPQPVFLSRRVEVVETRPLGNHGRHLRLKLRQSERQTLATGQAPWRGGGAGGGPVWDAVAFGLAERHALPSGLLDVVYTLGVNSWQGQQYLELRLLDFAASATTAVAR